MAKKRVARRAEKSKLHKYTMGSIWFLAILILSAIGSSPRMVNIQILWLLLMVCGAIVAIYNIRKQEEISFLIASATLLVIVICMQTTAFTIMPIVDMFVFNLGIAFGTAAFVVALALIAKLGLEK